MIIHWEIDVEPPAAFKEELKKLALEPVPGMHRYMSNAGYSVRRAVADALANNSGLPFLRIILL